MIVPMIPIRFSIEFKSGLLAGQGRSRWVILRASPWWRVHGAAGRCPEGSVSDAGVDDKMVERLALEFRLFICFH